MTTPFDQTRASSSDELEVALSDSNSGVLPPGSRVGHCRIIRKVFEGGMGVVYRAHDETLERTVAVKVVSAALMRNADQLARFQREARLLARLEHPNVVQVYQLGELPTGAPYLVMQWIEGQSLAERMRDSETPPPEEGLEIIIQAAHGLHAAHQQGIVHRDVKPANILLRTDGIVKVADFGLARSDVADVDVSHPGSIIGTPAFMAPEQLDARPVDARTDVYALGLTAFCTFTNRRPFTGSSLAELLTAQLTEPIPSMLPLVDVPKELDKFVRRMGAKNPNARPQSMVEVIDALERILREARPEKGSSSSRILIPRALRDTPVPEAVPADPPPAAQAAHAPPLPPPAPGSLSDSASDVRIVSSSELPSVDLHNLSSRMSDSAPSQSSPPPPPASGTRSLRPINRAFQLLLTLDSERETLRHVDIVNEADTITCGSMDWFDGAMGYIESSASDDNAVDRLGLVDMNLAEWVHGTGRPLRELLADKAALESAPETMDGLRLRIGEHFANELRSMVLQSVDEPVMRPTKTTEAGADDDRQPPVFTFTALELMLSLAASISEDLDDYATKLFRAWGDKADAALLLVRPTQRNIVPLPLAERGFSGLRLSDLVPICRAAMEMAQSSRLIDAGYTPRLTTRIDGQIMWAAASNRRRMVLLRINVEGQNVIHKARLIGETVRLMGEDEDASQ